MRINACTRWSPLGLVAACAMMLMAACETDDNRNSGFPGDSTKGTPIDLDGDGVIDGYDTTGDGQIDTPVTSDETVGKEDEEGSCEDTLKVVYRDFTSAHPDFERSDLGWGPAQGMVKDTLGDDRKPVFNKLHGDYQVKDPNCADTCPNGGFLSNATLQPTGDNWGSEPMWTDADTFREWYTDVENVNKRIESTLRLEPTGNGSYVYDNPFFFPLDNKEGTFGMEAGQLDETGTQRNFLFTTEIHLEFQYTGQGQVFTFRGDDDLWIFVNNKLALDLGGLHWPFEGTIDFDAKAAELGLEAGNAYPMDVFHAERHTEASNFRIETNIACFQSEILIE